MTVSNDSLLFRRDDSPWRCPAHWKSRRNSRLSLRRKRPLVRVARVVGMSGRKREPSEEKRTARKTGSKRVE